MDERHDERFRHIVADLDGKFRDGIAHRIDVAKGEVVIHNRHLVVEAGQVRVGVSGGGVTRIAGSDAEHGRLAWIDGGIAIAFQFSITHCGIGK